MNNYSAPKISVDINQLIDVSKQVFNDCLLPNGCLVAAPCHMPYYPKEAKSYMYAWPGRDTGFNLAAMALVGEDHYEPIIKWIWDRAEDFQTSVKPEYLGLIYRSYHPSGLIREHQFQPDQGATLIWSIHFKHQLKNTSLSEMEKIVLRQLAENYVRVWDSDKFKLAIEDIWEERGLIPGEGIFIYSLASCIKGMFCAAELLEDAKYSETAKSMRQFLLNYCFKCHDNTVPRHFGGSLDTDYTPDGSLSGIVWPFNVGFSSDTMISTLNKMEDELVNQTGIYRYPEDRYEGKASRHHSNEEAGTWPLLTFWLSIAWAELGYKDKALKYFNTVFESMDEGDLYIPEQIFHDRHEKWQGIKPLVWSHSMAIFAAWKLGLLDKS